MTERRRAAGLESKRRPKAPCSSCIIISIFANNNNNNSNSNNNSNNNNNNNKKKKKKKNKKNKNKNAPRGSRRMRAKRRPQAAATSSMCRCTAALSRAKSAPPSARQICARSTCAQRSAMFMVAMRYL